MNVREPTWRYALAADVTVEPASGGTYLVAPAGRMWLEGSAGDVDALRFLSAGGGDEEELGVRFGRGEPGSDPAIRTAALLFRLDRLGLLVRQVAAGGLTFASCEPRRAPPGPPPDVPRGGLLRLSPWAFAVATESGVRLERPDAWATVTLHHRELASLLFDLSLGGGSEEMAGGSGELSGDVLRKVLTLMDWCGLLDAPTERGWSRHEILFHARTRRGYDPRVRLGKTYAAGAGAANSAPPRRPGRPRVSLPPVDPTRMRWEDPPLALVMERRRSIRKQGGDPLTVDQLSEFLFRTLAQRGGRRPHPSAGGLYPLSAYLCVDRCGGLDPGLFQYEPSLHELSFLGPPGPGTEQLLADAAGAADVPEKPQVLLVLAARNRETHAAYGDLGYSLILKEVGAVFQAAAMAAAAMGLAACPLGTGNALAFAEASGLDPLVEPSVGELMLGSPGDDDPVD